MPQSLHSTRDGLPVQHGSDHLAQIRVCVGFYFAMKPVFEPTQARKPRSCFPAESDEFNVRLPGELPGDVPELTGEILMRYRAFRTPRVSATRSPIRRMGHGKPWPESAIS